MPSHYLYQCRDCDYRRNRYRNVKNCPKCGGGLDRVYGEQITADVSEEQRQALHALAAQHGLTWTEYCRELADRFIEDSEGLYF